MTKKQMTDTSLDAFCRDNQITLDATLLGYVADNDKPRDKRWPHFAWRVTITRGDQSFATDYRTGTGHAKPLPDGYRRDLNESARLEAWFSDKRTPIVPTVASALSSLLSDTQTGLDTFDEYCSSFGLDTDSRKALDTYLACQTIGSAIRRVLRELYSAACEAAQDYW